MLKVSVVIPVFNGERFIGDAIQSALNQNFKDFEIIVVDDGSTDGTAKIVGQFSDRLSYYNQKNQGAGVARNLGVFYAQGEWVAFLDADDVWYPDKLAIQVRLTDAYPEVSLFYSDMDAINEGDQSLQKGFLSAKLQRRKEKKRQNLSTIIFNDRPCPYPSTVLVKRNVFLKAGGFNPLFVRSNHEDFELFARIARISSIHFIPQSLVQYRIHETQGIQDPSSWWGNWPILLNSLWEMWRDEPENQVLLLFYYAKYFSDQGKHLFESGDYQKAREYFRLAFAYQPFYWRNFSRWILSLLPGIREFYISRKSKVP